MKKNSYLYILFSCFIIFFISCEKFKIENNNFNLVFHCQNDLDKYAKSNQFHDSIINGSVIIEPENSYCFIGDDLIGDSSIITDITDLSALSNIIKIKGSLILKKNKLLQNLNGLNNLEEVESFYLRDNDKIVDLNDLNSIKKINYILFSGNDNLASISQLENIQMYEHGSIIISNNLKINELAFYNIDRLYNLEFYDKFINFSNSNFKEIDVLGINRIDSIPFLNSKIKYEQIRLEYSKIVTLTFLDSVKYVESLFLSNLPKLISIKNLIKINNLKRIDIRSCESLTNIDGLDSLKDIERIWILSNPNLNSLSGLNNLIKTSDLNIDNNNGLLSLDGLENLSYAYNCYIILVKGANFCALKNFAIVNQTEDWFHKKIIVGDREISVENIISECQ